MLLTFALFACTGTSEDTGSESVAAPTIAWLSPSDGDTVAAGDITGSVVVADFTLDDPAKHNGGAPIGYVEVSVDAAVVTQTGGTTFTLTLDAGVHDLTAQLFYADGDEVSATTVRLCDEDDTDTTCEAALTTIRVTAE